MPKKMTGAEYKTFLAADWDTLFGLKEAYVDGQDVTVNGESEPDDWAEISDSAQVVINGGCVTGTDAAKEIGFEAAYLRWKKSRTVQTLVIEIPIEKLEALKEAVKSLSGKIVC